jgi:hypothetical protein
MLLLNLEARMNQKVKMSLQAYFVLPAIRISVLKKREYILLLKHVSLSFGVFFSLSNLHNCNK